MTLVIIPLILALIFASAFGPVTMWMRRKGVPAVLATLLTLLAVVVVLSALGWLVVNAVIDQWAVPQFAGTEGLRAGAGTGTTRSPSPSRPTRSTRPCKAFKTS